MLQVEAEVAEAGHFWNKNKRCSVFNREVALLRSTPADGDSGFTLF